MAYRVECFTKVKIDRICSFAHIYIIGPLMENILTVGFRMIAQIENHVDVC